MSALWKRIDDLVKAAVGPGPAGELARAPRAAWALLAASVARAAREEGRSTLVLASHPDRIWQELRPWLAGSVPLHLFAEVSVSFLDRPPAFDQAVGRRL